MADPDSRFANYVDAPSRVPHSVWRAARSVVLAGFFAIVVAAVMIPDDTLTLFWGVFVPVLPAVWMLAPGIWRNTCPLATANQIPRVFGFSRAATPPRWFQKFGYSIGFTAFVVFVLLRKVTLNTNGTALAAVMLALVALSFLGGVLFKGKSGWCSAICPLLPIQRLYGQAAAARVANAHCDPCLGCTPNCFDFNPGVAYLADVYDSDPQVGDQRTLFAGAFPGLVIGFFTVDSAREIGTAAMVGQSLLWIIASTALYRVLHVYAPHRTNTLPPFFGAVGFALFYWFGIPRVADAVLELTEIDVSFVMWPGRAAALLVAAQFMWRAFHAESRYVEETVVTLTARAEVPTEALRGGIGTPSVKFVGEDAPVDAPGEPTLLEMIEAAGRDIQVGCRMGVCGADPVSVVAGSQGLTPPLPSELTTLSRLGLGPPNRMACVARVTGACTISLEPDPNSVPEPEVATFRPDPGVGRVIVVGNGIAGITAADYVRRGHPDCDIDVIGREAYHLYNRMGISKLIFSPRGPSSLNLLGDEWYVRNRITPWLNTTVRGVDTVAQTIELGTGETLGYDRLILAMGSTAAVPPIEGFDQQGCFVVRSAEHAVRIRRFIQRHNCQRALVAGGGLLGLEAAFSLHQLGLSVTVVERSERLLRRQVDERGSEILRQFFVSVGMHVQTQVSVASVHGATRVRSVTTAAGDELDTDVFVVAAGIVPNVGLATAAGLTINRGVVVDDHMRTSGQNVFAAGDLAEQDGSIWGLWAVAVAQAEVAGTNAAGGAMTHTSTIPVTVLKGAGIDLTSFGIVQATAADQVEVTVDSVEPFAYAKTVRRGGRVVGGVFINRADEAVAAQLEYTKPLAEPSGTAGVS